jgi:hypothetical protein
MLAIEVATLKNQKGFVFCEELFPQCSYHAGILASCYWPLVGMLVEK